MEKKNIEILSPRNQLQLYGYNKYFDLFINLFKKNKLPNTILLSGIKGLGKSTFAYHFINYLLSLNEVEKYSLSNFTMNFNNKSYKSLINKTHSNFFLLDNNLPEESIKIDNVRNILKFLNKTTYNSDIKIVLIDNAEYLNVNSSNALLKALEEPNKNTFFFIIHNSSSRIIDTIKSRCLEFKFFFNFDEKKNILKNMMNQYQINSDLKDVEKILYIDSPGNTLRYMKYLQDNNIEFTDKLNTLNHLIDEYKQKKDSYLLRVISFIIEIFYNDLALTNKKDINFYFHNKFKILTKINYAKKFNLDKNNLFISIQDMIKNEK